MSPVIATVILVAVAITVAVAVAYWMGGIAGQYTKFEKIEIQSAVCTLNAAGNWTIVMKLKNTGTATATLNSAFINNLELNAYNTTSTLNEWTANMSTAQAITSGQSMTIEIYIDDGRPQTTLSSGTTINIKIHSSGGMDYIKLVELI